MQIQADKEKLLYELDNLQNQLEKAQLSSNRFQTEREDFQMDADRHREKCEKLQVGWCNGTQWGGTHDVYCYRRYYR